MVATPVALAHDTIWECVFEMRFSEGHPSASDLLPGVIFSKLPGHFKKFVPMPLGQIPPLLRAQNPQLRYIPIQALEGAGLRLLIGPHAVAVSFAKPYLGWTRVRPLILECMNAVFDTKLTGRPERFALKYVNLLQHGRDEFDLAQTTLNIELGKFERKAGSPAMIHAEIEQNGCISIVDIASGAKIATPGTPDSFGVLISVDTVLSPPSGDARAALPDLLDKVHSTEKEIFFGLLSKETLEKLGPQYPTSH
jgi:uncharacterized protein (TIGR04255 family)